MNNDITRVVTCAESLKVGDTVEATRDGYTHTYTVTRTYNDLSIGSANSRTVTLNLRPGGHSFEVRNDSLAKYAVTRVAKEWPCPSPIR